MPPPRRRAAQPLLTPARLALVVFGALGFALFIFLLVTGGFGRALTAMGLYQPPSLGPAGIAPGRGPLNIAGEDLAMLKYTLQNARQTTGEWPTLARINEADPRINVVDPWGRPYRLHFTPDRQRCWLSTDGPDGLPDTPDDVITAKIP